MVMGHYHKPVGVSIPSKSPAKPSKKWRDYKHIREAALQTSEFPSVLTDGIGSFHNQPRGEGVA